MKKISLFIAPIVAALFLIGCGGGGSGPEKVNFTVTGDVEYIKGSKQASIELDWAPTSHSITVFAFTFELLNQKSIYVDVEVTGASGDRPLPLLLLFNSDLESDDQGKLKFEYIDYTAGGARSEGVVNNINIKVTDPHEVNANEFNAAAEFNDVTYLQMEEEGATKYRFSPDAYFEQLDLAETFIFKVDSKYNRYFSQNPEVDNFILIEDVDSREFFTPQTLDDNPSSILELYDLEYDNFTYNKILGVYTATHTESNTTFTLKFNNKKLVSMDLEGASNRSFTYTYEENPITEPTVRIYDELSLQSGSPIQDEIEVEDGNIYIKFTNAEQCLENDSTLSVQCYLPNEELTEQDDEAYYSVEGYSKTGTAWPAFSVDASNKKQCWDFTFDDYYEVNSEFYLKIELNEDFVSPTTGKGMKQDFSGEINCNLSYEMAKDAYAIWINFEEIAAD